MNRFKLGDMRSWPRLGRLVMGLAGAIGLAGLSTQGALAQDCDDRDGEETVEIDKGSIDIRVYYREGDCNNDGEWPQSTAETLLYGASDSLDRYRDLDFMDPWQNGLPEYKITVPFCDTSTSAPKSCTIFCSERTSTNFDPCTVDDVFMLQGALHEMYHHIQYAHACETGDCDLPIGAGNWFLEGTARYMQDILFDSLDQEYTDWWAGYVGEINDSLGMTDLSLIDQSYNACLFWTYCGEQLGTSASEPNLGHDFQVELFANITADGDLGNTSVLSTLDNTVQSFGDRDLDELWLDYAIANYAKDWDLSLITGAERYAYVDENQHGEGGWDSVDTIAVGFPTSSSSSVAEYSAKYFVATPNLSTCLGIGFRGEADESVGWAALAIDDKDQVIGISKGFGTEFGRTFINTIDRRINKIVGIVAGLDEAASFDYWFDSGALELDIEDPDLTRPAMVRVDDGYRPFLVQLIVDGPDNLKPEGAGDRSVGGLLVEDFEAQVGGIDSTIVTANYVGQYYWLIVAAPASLPEGLYDLTITLCDNGEAMQTNVASVAVADVVFNHMLVVDQSGSMGDPAGNTKLDSAKIAASLYAASVSEADRIGLVSFNGNNVDCDDDAILREAIDLADVAQKSAINTDLIALVPSGWTTIGDGLWKAQDELDTVFDLADANFVVLLSDGMENEARRWNIFDGCDSAASRILGEETVIHTMAFGPEADADLMMDISADTDGEYQYIDVAASGARGAGQSQANELADAYLDALQEVRRLERFFFEGGELPFSAQVDIPIEESDLKDVIFAFNAGMLGAGLKVDLFDPDGVLVPVAVATKIATGEHAVYHFFGSPKKGTWTAELTSSKETDYIAAVLGRNPKSPKLDVELLGIPAGGLDGRAACDYEQGIPVTILAFLHDDDGAIPGADVLAEVERPDGSISCSLYRLVDDGSQNDGQPNDGLYGFIYTETGLGGGGGVINDDPNQPDVSGTRGSYQVRIQASGLDSSGAGFERLDNVSFNVCAVPDIDADGMVDSWEIYYGTILTSKDETLDYDLDGLINREEFDLGTHPFDEDTDGDGEPDGSEVKHGRCPTNPDDLAIHAPIDVEVVTDFGDRGIPLPSTGLFLRFPWHSEYKAMHVERAKGSPVDFKLIASVTPSDDDPMPVTYLDADDLGVGTEYFYRFYAEALDGGISRYSRIVSATFFPDCNGNGVDDPTDIALGNSNDCQGNGVPDECDLTGGASVDLNDNGIPDECEAVECEGDTNGDGAVDPLDSGFVLARLGCTVGAGDPLCDQADANGDGIVDPLDVGYVLSRFGVCE